MYFDHRLWPSIHCRSTLHNHGCHQVKPIT